MMRSEAEIRREVETRLLRRGLLLLNGGLWAAAVFILSIVMPRGTLGTTLTGLLTVGMLAWTLVLLLHAFRVVYVELRERLVNSAIERERQFYLLRENYEKQKRSEERERADSAFVHLSDDGELVDAPDARKVKASYER
jgi:hypothetical protein